MNKINKQSITKALSIGVMLMGLVHIAATFTPLIAGKLAVLQEGVQDAFTYFSLMCGTLLILGGIIIHTLSGRTAKYAFVRTPYILTLAILSFDGILAVCYMPHNPFAWIIFMLTMGLLFVNAIRLNEIE